MAARIEIGTFPERRFLLRQAHIAITFNSPIPLVDTPFGLKGIVGDACVIGSCNPAQYDPLAYDPTASLSPAAVQGTPIYAFMLTAEVVTMADTSGNLFRADVRAVLSSIGDLGIGGVAHLFGHVLEAQIGLCLLHADLPRDSFITREQYARAICTAVVPRYAAPQLRTEHGLTAALSGELTLTLNKTAHIGVSAGVAVPFPYGYLAASLSADGTIPAGFVVDGFPWSDLNASAKGQLDYFNTPNGQRAYGILASVDLPLPFGLTFTATGFYDSTRKTFSAVDQNQYTLDTSQTNGARLVGVGTGAIAPAVRRERHGSEVTHSAASAADGAFRIVPGQRVTIFDLTWHRGSPTLTLTAPDGTVITPAHPGPGYFHAETRTRALNRGTTSALIYVLGRPQASLWHVRVGNLAPSDDAVFRMLGGKPIPTLRVDSPAGSTSVVARPGRGGIILAGTLAGGSPTTTVSLAYATARTLKVGSRLIEDATGVSIVRRVPVRHEHWSYRWRVDAVPSGRYVIIATLDDAAGPLVSVQSPGDVLIRQPARLDRPLQVTGREAKGRLVVRWLAPTPAGDIAGYIVRWGLHGAPVSSVVETNVGRALQFVLTEPIPGARYDASVIAYTADGRRSSAVAARIARPAPPTPHRRPGRPRHPRAPVHPGRHAAPAFVSLGRDILAGRGATRATVRPSGLLAEAIAQRQTGAASVVDAVTLVPQREECSADTTADQIATPSMPALAKPSRKGSRVPIASGPQRPPATHRPPAPVTVAQKRFTLARFDIFGPTAGAPPVAKVSAFDLLAPPRWLRKDHNANAKTNYGSGYLDIRGKPIPPPGSGDNLPNPPAIRVYYSPLQYVPLATSGLAAFLDSQKENVSDVKNKAPFRDYYCRPIATCDEVGRASGIVTLVSPAALRTTGLGFYRSKSPPGKILDPYRNIQVWSPGWVESPKLGRQRFNRGHLLGYVLDGPGDDPRNFVTQYLRANNPGQSNREIAVKDALARGSDQIIFYSATPMYANPRTVIAEAVVIKAVGPNGFFLDCRIDNDQQGTLHGRC